MLLTPIIIPMRSGSIGGGACRMPSTPLEYYSGWTISILLCLLLFSIGLAAMTEGDDFFSFILGLLAWALIPMVISTMIIGCLINGV